MKIRFSLNFLIVFFLLTMRPIHAQSELPETQTQTVIDASPYISARAASMAGALSSLADGLNAPYYNPAGIGGLHWERKKPPFIRHLSFPYIGAVSNENSTKMAKEFDRQNASTDKALGQGIFDANAGKRQFGRFGGLFSFGMGRTLLLHSQDTQLSAFKSSGEDENSGGITASYRGQSTTGFGASFVDEKGQFYLGFFSSYISRDLYKGDITFTQIASKPQRADLINENVATYAGGDTNYGGIFVFSKKHKPALGISVRHAGGTRLKRQKSPSNTSLESVSNIKIEEVVSMGFSVSPKLSKHSFFNFIVEGHDITAKELSVHKKFRTAIEMNLDGFGSDAVFSARAGYNLAGVSYGASLNLNLVQLEFASQAEDIGIDNRHVVERRNVVIFSVNVTDD